MMISKSKKIALICLAVVLFAILLIIELFNGKIFISESYGELHYSIVTRFIGGLACMIFIYVFSSARILSFKTTFKKFLIFLPCMAVAINNFPFITFFNGEAYIDSPTEHVVLYALFCLGVGFFEEMAFRGCIFTVILQRRRRRFVDVFVSIVLSSVVFGAVHIVNLFAGASVGSVLLQICYSFLIGGMCSIILIRTSNIWYCVILHAVYNFAGGVIPECGGGVIWSVPTIILTTVVALAVTAYVVYLMIMITPAQLNSLFTDNKNKS